MINRGDSDRVNDNNNILGLNIEMHRVPPISLDSFPELLLSMYNNYHNL